MSPDLRRDLLAVYQEMIWLANRPRVTASNARSWFTHVMAEKMKRRVLRFTGKVSKLAVENESTLLRLEHFKRIQTTLTKLVERHCKNQNADEFIRVVLDCERVHIVTLRENYAAVRAKGNYREAGIELLSWHKLSASRQRDLWKKMLRGKVANANKYAPKINETTP